MAITESTSESDCRSPDTFADLRSASHANHRARKSSFTAGTYVQAQRPIPVHVHKQRGNRSKRSWARASGRKIDAHLACGQYTEDMVTMFGRLDMRRDEEWIEDIAHREWEGGDYSEACLMLGATWEDVACRDPWTEVGETFSAWARRRVDDMRQVKEARLRAKLAASAAGMQLGEVARSAIPARAESPEVPSTSLTTTLPVAASDVKGHAQLDYLFHPPWRREPLTIPGVQDFGFFDEYEWYWHRNLTGCFELTSWAAHSTSPWWQCYCDVYAPCGDWSPEDPIQPFSLGEFVRPGEAALDEHAGAQHGEVEDMRRDILDMHDEVASMQGVVEDARKELVNARREVHEDGMCSDQETKDVCDRMGEVYARMESLQRGLVALLDGYQAVYAEASNGDSNTVT